MPLAVGAEISPGQQGDVGVVQEVIGELLGGAREGELRKDVKRAGGFGTSKARRGVQRVDEVVSTRAVLVSHLANGILRTGEGDDTGLLGEGGDASNGMDGEKLQAFG